MGSTIDLTSADGHVLSAYRTGGERAERGLVVVQEIFGVNHHMREVCDGFAAAGYAVIAPAMFDRVERGVELGYGPEDMARGRELRTKVPEAGVILDIEAAAAALGGLPAGIVGYCWGGTVAWWGATRSRAFKAAVGWYGGGIAATRTERPNCPVQLHFGEKDAGIPLADVEAIRAAQPEVEVFVYPGAGHGFGCTERDSFKPDARDLALQRTLDFLAKYVPARAQVG
ncbi:MAG TPA: dienelactone hydrolase family protein [Acetobacteraceae bacterium]|nr:dienelactone hydrolase family protein [Acetobacteraceae bacterium]